MTAMANSRNIARDAWPSIRAFREAGEVSFQDLGVEQARINYEVSCAANGIPAEELHSVNEIVLDPVNSIRARVYHPHEGDGDLDAGILFIHGGGWVIGSLDTHDTLCRFLARQTGSVVISVNYRLAPEHPYPAAIEDCRTGLKWIAAHAADLGIDPKRIAVVGDSAGANMAAVLVNESAQGKHPVSVRAQVLLYPVTDLAMDTPSYSRVTRGFPLTDRTMRWFADLYVPDKSLRSAADLSPLRSPVPEPGPATFVVTVEHDPLCDEGIRYAALLAEAGTSVTHLHLAGYAHGLFTSAGKIPHGMDLLKRVATFLRRVTT